MTPQPSKKPRHRWIFPSSCDEILRKVYSWDEFQAAAKLLGISEAGNKHKGDLLERFVQFFLRYQPEYQQQLEAVWLYSEVPVETKQQLDLPVLEKGIDLVAKTKDGDYWAIQAKYRADPAGSIPFGDLGTFGSQLLFARGFARGVICATKREKTPDFARSTFPVEHILLDTWESIEDETWANIRQAAAGEKVEPLDPYKPHKYQAAAVNAARQHFLKEGKRRGKLIMPCGTGKSLMGYWTTVKALKAKTVVVAVPSLDLIRQTFAVWAREAVANRKRLDVLIVCSDKSTAEGDSHVGDLAAPATTDPSEIKQWLKNPQHQSDLRVVFVTYQSGKKFADAAGRFQFDAALYDEAHKTAGYQGKRNQHLLYQANLNVRHRIFMTATERYYEGESDEMVGMNDKRLYGERYHYMPFAEAINDGILADYSVVLLAIHRSEAEEFRALIEERMFVRPDLESAPEELTAEELATAVALRKAFKKYKLNHAVSFHSRNRQAMEFVEVQQALNGAGLSAKLKTFRVSSDISTGKRHEQIRGFEEAKNALISNARCLTEGVDVPGIDLVLFAQPRQSKVDIVQAVGRALRVPPDQPDKRGYILVPVLVDDDEEDLENIVRGTGFENLVSILKAMATVDEDVTERISVVVGRKSKRTRSSEADGEGTGEVLPVRLDIEQFAESLRLRAWDRISGLRKSRLTVEKILEWADAYYARTGQWPKVRSGEIEDAPGMNWLLIDNALARGVRGLQGGSSLATLLAEKREVRNPRLIRYSEEQILKWADEHFRQTGEWPAQNSGEIPDAPGESWKLISKYLVKGGRGLNGGYSLSRILFDERGVYSGAVAPKLDEQEILKWADSHYARTGEWPNRNSGEILESPNEKWSRVDHSLKSGGRGLPDGSSLSQFLQTKRGIRHSKRLPDLTTKKILRWADEYYQQNEKWPTQYSREIESTDGETWSAVQSALRRGRRGLAGNSSIAQLLVEERGIRLHNFEPMLSESQILEWADTYFATNGEWPKEGSGPIPKTSENWNAISAALRVGSRGLLGDSSLANLLNVKRGVRSKAHLPSLSEDKILEWADAHHKRTGAWPKLNSGIVVEAPEENWSNMDQCISHGRRGLPSGGSLAKLLWRQRGVRNPKGLPPLSEDKILEWADAHRERTGEWPRVLSGEVLEAPGETWSGIRTALRNGVRGLPGGTSLAKLLSENQDR